MPMNLSEMKLVLAERSIQLTKSLGQNFLHDGNQLRRIIEAAELQPADAVLEVGPGLGPLTEQLLRRVGRVLAIEKDRRLVEVLKQRFGPEAAGEPTAAPPQAPRGQLELVHDDALEYLRRDPRDWTGWKLVANLPYSVASPILVELALGSQPPQRMVVTLQIEVARRLTARPQEKDYGVLTLLVQLKCEPCGWFKIPASCFFPEPEIDSACIVLRLRQPGLLPPGLESTFVRLVKTSFSQRRKVMLKLLKAEWPADLLERAFKAIGLPPLIRAEAVSLDQFVALTRYLHGQASLE
jgi:16S rRNA (adenine1518-N6/adenine1519-N6)-dimethyltransferase